MEVQRDAHLRKAASDRLNEARDRGRSCHAGRVAEREPVARGQGPYGDAVAHRERVDVRCAVGRFANRGDEELAHPPAVDRPDESVDVVGVQVGEDDGIHLGGLACVGCRVLEHVPQGRAELLFELGGPAAEQSLEELPDDAQVCNCNGVSKGQIVDCVHAGATTVAQVMDRTRAGKGTFADVMRGLKLLQNHGVDYNVLACVARDTAKKPLEVYSFMKSEGIEYIQFTPVIERMSDEAGQQRGLSLAGPAALDREEKQVQVTPWTVVPEEYGDFLIAICEDWVRHDVGKVFVMNFEWILNAWIGNPSPVCVHAKQCGRALVIEHNGDVYSCDHFVEPNYLLGNIQDRHMIELVASPPQVKFGLDKRDTLPRYCRECDVRFACHGECPKNRFILTPDGDPGLNYLCAGAARP